MKKTTSIALIGGCAALFILAIIYGNVLASIAAGIATAIAGLYVDACKGFKKANPYKADLIKIFKPSDGTSNHCAQIYTRRYLASLEYIQYLADELKADFPGITDADIHVHKYGGSSKKGIAFVEVMFDRKRSILQPHTYEIVKEIEYIL